MCAIVRILIKGESGFCSESDAYTDKLTITGASIRYEYKPRIPSDNNAPLKWSYKTTSSAFAKLFHEVCVQAEHAMSLGERGLATDVGVTTFELVYADKTRQQKGFLVPSYEFYNCFSLIKEMIPECEAMPHVLQA